jgi:hypothetical protein
MEFTAGPRYCHETEVPVTLAPHDLDVPVILITHAAAWQIDGGELLCLQVQHQDMLVVHIPAVYDPINMPTVTGTIIDPGCPKSVKFASVRAWELHPLS